MTQGHIRDNNAAVLQNKTHPVKRSIHILLSLSAYCLCNRFICLLYCLWWYTLTAVISHCHAHHQTLFLLKIKNRNVNQTFPSKSASHPKARREVQCLFIHYKKSIWVHSDEYSCGRDVQVPQSYYSRL